MFLELKNDDEIEALIAHLNGKISAIGEEIQLLEAQQNELRNRSSEIENEYFKMKFFKEIDNMSAPVYNPIWTVVKKTEYVLRHQTVVVLSTREIMEHINILEGGTFTEPQKREWVSKLGATLKQKIDKGETFNRCEAEGGEFLYGLREWFFGDSKIKGEYMNIKYRLKQPEFTIEDYENLQGGEIPYGQDL